MDWWNKQLNIILEPKKLLIYKKEILNGLFNYKNPTALKII